MAKSKNHTNHNQNYKAHRNGIRKVKNVLYINRKGQNQKLLRNTRYARKFDPTIKKSKNLTRRIEKLQKLGIKVLLPVKKVLPVKTPALPVKKDASKKEAAKSQK